MKVLFSAELFRKSTVIFPEISGKIPPEISGNFRTHNPNDQAFGRYNSLKGAEKWFVTITKIERLHISTRRKIHWFLNATFFDLRWIITKLSRKTVSEQWRHQALVAFSARHSSRTKHRSRILSYSFDLESCLYKYAWYAATRWRNLLSNLPKN